MIATYNQPNYIVQAVQSCLNQDYENIEVVVGDDSTNDDVFVELFPLLTNPKVKYFRNETNLGRVKNYRKLLFDYAKGDWAMMLDGDDYYLDNTYLTKAVKWINENENVVLIAAGFLNSDENTGVETKEILTENDKIFDGKEMYYQQMKVGQHSTNIYNRKLALELDFYRIESMGTDSEGLFRIALHGNVVYLKDMVVLWRIHQVNNTFKPEDAIKQMKEMFFIDNIYQYALNFIGVEKAKKWRFSMYNSMSHHILTLAENSKNKFTMLRVSLWASKYWGFVNTLRYIKRVLLK